MAGAGAVTGEGARKDLVLDRQLVGCLLIALAGMSAAWHALILCV